MSDIILNIAMLSEKKKNYQDVFKATTIIGGSSLISILVGMAKTKFAALLIGPAGVGLIGIMNSMTGIVSTVSGMGLNSSGVRQVAVAVGEGDERRIANTVLTLRRTVWITGFTGLMIMVFGSPYWSKSSFGTYEYTVQIAFLGLSVFFATITTGQSCVLQGFRRIPDLARVGIIGSVNGLLISVPCYYFLGTDGVVPSLVLGSAALLATSWWFARRIPIRPAQFAWKDSRVEASKLLGLGLPLMLSALVTTLCAYLINAYLARNGGLESVGLFQAAYGLSGILVNFILNAMGTDYYPRLTAIADNVERLNTEVNMQTEVGLLLAVPAIAGTILFMPLVVSLFYSGKFDGAVGILRWAVFGVFGRVISWPLAYIPLAKGMGKTFLAAESLAGAFYLFAVWLGFRCWGLPGAGIGFAMLYLFYTTTMLSLAYALARVLWTRKVLTQILLYLTMLVLLSVICVFEMNPYVKWGAGASIVAGLSGYNIWRLEKITGGGMTLILKKIKGFLR